MPRVITMQLYHSTAWHQSSQAQVNAAALENYKTIAANGVTAAVPSCNASQCTAYAAANGGISMYAANELGNATQNGQFAMAQTNGVWCLSYGN